MTDDKAEIALKYLDLARAEILAKSAFVNQTLGTYIVGSAALASWFYQAVYNPSTKTLSPADQASAAVGLALMLAYLALGVNWITHHNERIIGALADYQKKALTSSLSAGPPMWENSAALQDEDSLGLAFTTVAIQELIILGPPIAAFIFARRELHLAPPNVHFWLDGAIAANIASLLVGGLMLKTKFKLRIEAWLAKRHSRANKLPARGTTGASK